MTIPSNACNDIASKPVTECTEHAVRSAQNNKHVPHRGDPTTERGWAQQFKSAFYGMMLGLMVPSLALAQTATLAPNAALQYTDDANVPLASGQVFYYQPNTTTLKTVWQDAAETTPQPNPVQLDAAGRPQPAKQTYIDGCYQQKVVDVNNIQIWSAVTCSTGGGSGGGGTPSSEGVMVGTIIPWANTTLPSQYLYTAGQGVLRTTYPQLLTAITYQLSILCQSTISTVSVPTNVSDAVPIGTPIEASCFAPGTIVSAKSSGQLTFSNPAMSTVSVSAVLFPWGDGDGATTFTIPDLRGKVLAGRDNMNGNIAGVLTSTYYGVNPDAVNAVGGSQSETLTLAQAPTGITSVNPANAISVFPSGNTSGTLFLPATTGSISNINVSTAGAILVPQQGGGSWSGVNSFSANNQINVTSNNTSGQPHPIVQPSVTSDFIIKALPDDSPTGPGVSSIGGMTGAITCGAFLICTANTISVASAVPPPTAVSLGGVFEKTCSTSNWFSSVDGTGTFGCTQPNFTDLTGSIALAQIPNALITNVKLATVGAATIKGNPTATASVAPTDFTIAGLTAASACNTTVDFLIKLDAATGTLQKVSCSQIASSATAGVSSINGATGAILGIDTSTMNPQGGSYTIATTDCGATIYATGGQNTITLPAASGFPTACVVSVKNGEVYTGSSGRAKILTGNFPSDIRSRLWPLQTVTVKKEGSTWISAYVPGRWGVPTTVTLHVDPANGNNANDGLAATTGAVADSQTAWGIQQYQFDNQGTTAVIAMACSQTHTVPYSAGGTPLGTNLVQMSPDGNCGFTMSNAGPCISLGDLSELNLDINAFGSSGSLTTNCNITNAASTGAILEHNDVVLDQEGTVIWNPAGANDNYLFCDGMCQFTIANGVTQGGAAGGNYIINMSAGGHGTQSGTISASAAGAAAGVYYLFGGAILVIGTPNGGGWSGLGSSKVYGHATLVSNGITPAGGVTVGATGVNCSSLTASC